MAKKSGAIVPTMLRMREDLRKRIEREAKRNGRSLNAEMVERLEQSFGEQRAAALIDLLMDGDNVSSAALRHIATEIRKAPNALRSGADLKNLLAGLDFSAYGKEIQERIKSGEIPDDKPEGDER